MTGRENESTSDEEVAKVVDILRTMQDCARFELDRKDPSQISLAYDTGNPLFLTSSKRRIGVEDFLKAVDYYYENREAVSVVNSAMMKPEGVVRVYSPFRDNEAERQVVLSIRNYMVPQILEFAYLILRQNQKPKTGSNP